MNQIMTWLGIIALTGTLTAIWIGCDVNEAMTEYDDKEEF